MRLPSSWRARSQPFLKNRVVIDRLEGFRRSAMPAAPEMAPPMLPWSRFPTTPRPVFAMLSLVCDQAASLVIAVD